MQVKVDVCAEVVQLPQITTFPVNVAYSRVRVGCREDHGEGSGANEALCEEVHPDACEHSGRCTENTDAEVERRHGAGDEGCH